MDRDSGAEGRVEARLSVRRIRLPHLKENEVVLNAVRPAARMRHYNLHIIQPLVGFREGQGVGTQEHLHKVILGPGDRTRAHLRSMSQPPEAPLPPSSPHPATHTPSMQCAALSTHCSSTRVPPHTCVPFTCTDAM